MPFCWFCHEATHIFESCGINALILGYLDDTDSLKDQLGLVSIVAPTLLMNRLSKAESRVFISCVIFFSPKDHFSGRSYALVVYSSIRYGPSN